MRKDRIYKKAEKKWGLEIQISQTIEELLELAIALHKTYKPQTYKPQTYKPQTYKPQNIYEEMADVEIMLEQLKCALRCRDMVKMWKETKLKRLEKRLEE